MKESTFRCFDLRKTSFQKVLFTFFVNLCDFVTSNYCDEKTPFNNNRRIESTFQRYELCYWFVSIQFLSVSALAWTIRTPSLFEFLDISTHETVFHPISKPTEKRVENTTRSKVFLTNSRCLEIGWNTVSSVSYIDIFSIETKTKEYF